MSVSVPSATAQGPDREPVGREQVHVHRLAVAGRVFGLLLELVVDRAAQARAGGAPVQAGEHADRDVAVQGVGDRVHDLDRPLVGRVHHGLRQGGEHWLRVVHGRRHQHGLVPGGRALAHARERVAAAAEDRGAPVQLQGERI